MGDTERVMRVGTARLEDGFTGVDVGPGTTRKSAACN
jgi:hypothetical protein